MIKFLKVGQGLCCIDVWNNLIYDCGGSIDKEKFYTMFSSIFKKEEKLKIVISHHHLDHIKYLDVILKNYNNSKVYVNNRYKAEWKLLPIYANYPCSFSFIDNAIVNGYHVYGQTHSKTMDLNKNSLLAEHKKLNILLTGDMPYPFIKKTWKNYREISIFQIPHHGSSSKATGKPSTLDPHAIFGVVSYGVGNSFKHPHVKKSYFSNIKEYIEVHN